MNVLSLFDGMSCGQIALDRLNIHVENYFASEIDKYAIAIAKANFPNTIHIGDVTKVNASDLPKIDLLIGGSPCQGFSFAGKQLNFEDPRSKLFFEFVRLLEECKPEYFFLENVKMKKEYQDVISQHLGVEPILINSALVCAQNRKRLYWTNIPGIKQPEDRGIFLKDILEVEVAEKYYISDMALDRIIRKKYSQPKINPDKTGALNTKNNSPSLSIDSGTTLILSSARQGVVNNRGKLIEGEKSNCIDANYHKGMDNHAQRTMVISLGCIKFGRTEEGKKLRKESMANGKDHTPFQAKEITGLDFEKMNTLTTAISKDNLVIQLNPSKESNNTQPFQQNRVYDINGISPCLCAQMSCGSHAILIPEATKKGYVEIHPGECFDAENPLSKTRRGRKMETKSNCLMAKTTDFMQYTEGFRIRRLTPTECERLQTVPDGYTSLVSDTQRYRMLGNGWTIDAIVHQFNNLPYF